MKILLFDIDGTLVRTDGAGTRAMNRAFEDLFGVPQAFDGIPMSGRTDRRILEDALTRAGVDPRRELIDRFHDCYAGHLHRALEEPESRKRVLPGVQPLLDALAAPPFADRVFLALLTGNCEQGARIKLEHFDLWRFFPCGAYGDDVHDRNELFPVAMARAQAQGISCAGPQDVFVVGDTELDVACAAAAGARSVAVATGTSSADALRRTSADVVFDDLRDTRAFLELL